MRHILASFWNDAPGNHSGKYFTGKMENQLQRAENTAGVRVVLTESQSVDEIRASIHCGGDRSDCVFSSRYVGVVFLLDIYCVRNVHNF